MQSLEIAYIFNSQLYMERFESLITFIEERGLLTRFYRELIGGVHSIGEIITKWQVKWKKHILQGVNRELFELFNGDEEKIFKMLSENNLLDYSYGELADRCYSVLVKTKNGYQRLSYSEAFKREVSDVVEKMDILISVLETLDDEVFNQKENWINYFKALKRAFSHRDCDELVDYWAEVDRVWMSITTPIQIGHPLEYYEDRYRKAVALEWDLRIINPKLQYSSDTKDNIKRVALEFANSIGNRAKEVVERNLSQIERTQLYIGQPMLYYGAELNGLFSAQVVPNDKRISDELGKKIFAYIDFIRERKRSRPVMELAINTFGLKFIQKQQKLINESPEIWNRIYDISTIGHEFGHILWMDRDTEIKMNRSGQFKNIEEFKATAGAIVAFLNSPSSQDGKLIEPFIDELVSRAVNLMAWREVDEVLPYYAEGLIHLELLYNSGLINFSKGMVEIDYSRFESFKDIYQIAYKELINIYLNRDDAQEFLSLFTIRGEGSNLLPITEEVYKFVDNYYENYKRIGNIEFQS